MFFHLVDSMGKTLTRDLMSVRLLPGSLLVLFGVFQRLFHSVSCYPHMILKHTLFHTSHLRNWTAVSDDGVP